MSTDKNCSKKLVHKHSTVTAQSNNNISEKLGAERQKVRTQNQECVSKSGG